MLPVGNLKTDVAAVTDLLRSAAFGLDWNQCKRAGQGYRDDKKRKRRRKQAARRRERTTVCERTPPLTSRNMVCSPQETSCQKRPTRGRGLLQLRPRKRIDSKSLRPGKGVH